ncbi:hypothetical protein [Streptomyces sp. McG3]|uniref:hypothetical protein n=1 Tax=Streptomyces sp. McG3 TaxID=2725483 RepID=UPI0020366CFA|nr:hypothetical protein [Streptomyces sp. McG3]
MIRTVYNGGREHACRQGLLADALVETSRQGAGGPSPRPRRSSTIQGSRAVGADR